MTPADDDEPVFDDDGMSLETDDELDDGDDEDTGRASARKKSARKKLILIAVCSVLILVIAGGGLAYFMGWLNPLLGIEEQHKVAEVQLGAPVSFAFPQIKADLKTSECRSPFLRITISVQLSESDLDRLEASQEKVVDQIIIHLRDQERQDIVGKAGSDQLRFDLVNIVNHAINPVRIHGIIFKEFVLQ